MNYFIGIDNSMQIDTVIGTVNEDDNDVNTSRLSCKIWATEYVSNLTKRPIGFRDLIGHGNSYYGWYISEYDFDRVMQIIRLEPDVEKYLKLTTMS